MALSADRNTPEMGSLVQPKTMNYPVATATTIYKGSLVVLNSGGFAEPATSATGKISVGRAVQQVVNSGANGALTVQVEQGVFKWAVNGSAITQGNINSLVYAYDDQTITLTSTSRSIAGTIYGFDSDGGAWVYTGLAAPVDGTTLTTTTNTANTANLAAAAALGIPICIPVILNTAVSGSVLATLVPGVAGSVNRIDGTVIAIVTGASKSAQLRVKIATVTTGGGLLGLTSANCATLGARITGTAVTSSNTFTAASILTLESVASTTFVEGQVLVNIYLAA